MGSVKGSAKGVEMCRVCPDSVDIGGHRWTSVEQVSGAVLDQATMEASDVRCELQLI